MNFFKSLCLATPAGIADYLYESFKQQCPLDMLSLKAYCDIGVRKNDSFEDLIQAPEQIPPVEFNDMDDILEAIEDWNFDLQEEDEEEDDEDDEDDYLPYDEWQNAEWENADIWGDIAIPEDAFDDSQLDDLEDNSENWEDFDDLMFGLLENDEHIGVDQEQNIIDDFGDDENNIFLLEGAEFDNAVNQAFGAQENGHCAAHGDIWDEQKHVAVGRANPEHMGYLMHGNVLVEYDAASRLIYQTTQSLTADNVDEAEHAHCEFLRITPRVPEGERLLAPHETWTGNDNRFDVAYLPQIYYAQEDECNKADVAAAREEPKGCCYCQESTLWNVFHQYYKFLLERCNNLTVCSGSLFTPEPHERMERLPVNGDMVPAATHFFKIIVAEQNDGTQRLECYKFKTGPFTVERPILGHFIVAKDELEKDTGSPMYRHIDPVSQETHSDFVPN